jgi:lipopolysaccharide/colanic/teichoic acid biosynthesis glycosyltransferase
MEQRIYADNLSEAGRLRLHVADSQVTDHVVADSAEVHEVPAGQVRTRVSWGYLFLKRLFDIGASLLLLGIFFFPLMIVALCIRWESPGPAIYRRRVLALQDWNVNRGEAALKTFPAYKLRTMIPDAEDYLRRHPQLFAAYKKDWKLENDPRITRLGAFLRSTSIDELPQLINVLKGEMSLIGPRMITVPELARYEADGPRLLSVKPGLTGLWQVSGRQELSYEERVRLDMIYVESRSLGMDFSILLQTVKCVLLRRGAY